MAPADAQQRPDSLDLARMSEGEIAAEIAQRMQAFRRTHNLPEDRPIYERPIYEQPAAKAPPRTAPPLAPSAAELPDPDVEGPGAPAARPAASPAESSLPEPRAPGQRPKDNWLRSDFSTDFSRIIAERGAAPAATATAAPPKLEIPPDLRRIPAAAAKRRGAKGSGAEPHETARRGPDGKSTGGKSTGGTLLKRAAILAVLGAVLWVAWPKPGGDVPVRPAALTPNLQALEDAAGALAGAPAVAPEAPATTETPAPELTAPELTAPEPTTPGPTTPEPTTPEPTTADIPTAAAPEQTARRIAPDVAPAADAIAARAADAPPQPAPTSLTPITDQSEAVAAAPIRKPESEPFTPEPFTPVARPFVPAGGDASPAAKPLTLKPGPYTPTAKPFAPDPLFQPKPKPFVPTPNP